MYTQMYPIHLPVPKVSTHHFISFALRNTFFLIYSREKGINVSIEHHILGTIFMENFQPCFVCAILIVLFHKHLYIAQHIFRGLCMPYWMSRLQWGQYDVLYLYDKKLESTRK